jgi:hypothetical protein
MKYLNWWFADLVRIKCEKFFLNKRGEYYIFYTNHLKSFFPNFVVNTSELR